MTASDGSMLTVSLRTASGMHSVQSSMHCLAFALAQSSIEEQPRSGPHLSHLSQDVSESASQRTSVAASVAADGC